MIEASHISKFYGSRLALHDVTFTVEKGETVGFLGVNGAGKSTAMRILTGFFRPASGHARIAGMDPQIAAARDNFGYLPEGNPLPRDMRVGEFLLFRAELKGLSRKKARIAAREAAERCGLGDMEGRMMAHLSKGYRQRAGLAESILTRPPVLILDEPTSGLDPGQAENVRGLMRELGKASTILLSSHILHDVEALCPRVVVIHQGEVAADGPTREICEKYVEERTVAMTIAANEPVREILRAVSGVRAVTAGEHSPGGEVMVRVAMPAGVDLRRELSTLCAERGWLVTEMHMEPAKLEDIFHRLARGKTRIFGPGVADQEGR